MYVEITSPTDFRFFDNVNKVVFHSKNGDTTYIGRTAFITMKDTIF